MPDQTELQKVISETLKSINEKIDKLTRSLEIAELAEKFIEANGLTTSWNILKKRSGLL